MPRYNVPRSKEFNDVYFFVEDGLAETRYVFLEGNNLPDAWTGQENFTICETGFGTGLNFLAVFKLWLETDESKRANNLHFISFEKYPLHKDHIEKYLSHWGELKNVLDKLLTIYPVDLEDGIYKSSVLEEVELTLIFGDMNKNIANLTNKVDCWFLDGFKPSSNPDMWSKTLFKNMARLSCDGTSFATFTAASLVRRELGFHGFDVRKINGFGRKRDMLIGDYNKCG